jgi:hypothetical protein
MQVILSSCLEDRTVESARSGTGDKFFCSVTASKHTKACLKVINAASVGGSGADRTQLDTLRANTVRATNPIRSPSRNVPARSKSAVNHGRVEQMVPPYSIQVLAFILK